MASVYTEARFLFSDSQSRSNVALPFYYRAVLTITIMVIMLFFYNWNGCIQIKDTYIITDIDLANASSHSHFVIYLSLRVIFRNESVHACSESTVAPLQGSPGIEPPLLNTLHIYRYILWLLHCYVTRQLQSRHNGLLADNNMH